MKNILWTFLILLWCQSSRAGESKNLEQFRPDPTTVVKIWQEQTQNGFEATYYQIQTGSHEKTVLADYSIRLRYASFDPILRADLPIVHGLEAGSGQKLFIVQFKTQILPQYLDEIRKLGAMPRYFLPNYAQIVFMTDSQKSQVESLQCVRWVGPYHPAFRLEEFLVQNADHAAQIFPRLRYNIMILDHAFEAKQSFASRIQKIGGHVDRADSGKFLVEATLTADQLFEVASWDEVLFIDRWSPGEKDMDKAREIGGANYVETMAGYTGQGVRGEVIDAGFNITHVDFNNHPFIQHTPVNSDSHGASTSGIVFGDGTGNPMGRGMLPDAQGIVADWDEVSVGTPRYTHTGELVQAPYFAVFQTASVGSARTTEYTTISADTDAALFDFDILHCQSQSNAGNRDSRPQAWAKNILSGGAVNHQDTLDRSDDCWCGDASIGPATDGRIKPDLCSFYDAIFTTTTGSNTAYTPSFGGTSGATPIIAGHVGIVFQMWSEGIFGNPVTPGASVFDNRCHMTTAKALLINTAYRYDFNGQNHDLTRVHQGWGMPNLQTLFDYRDNLFVIDETDVILPLQTNNYTVNVTLGTPSLNVTMTYADPPGNPAATVHRINNLDLRVISPSGTVYWGNNGLLEGNWSSSGGSANTVDTVECVFIQNPEPGAWTVEVIGAEINQDGHVETGTLDADYALVVTGALRIPGYSLFASESSLELCQPETSQFNLEIEPQLGYTEPVTLSSPGLSGISFSQNPVIPPASVTVTVDSTAITAGSHVLNIRGESIDITKNLYIHLMVNDQVPLAPSNLVPANGASDINTRPNFTWDPVAQANSYSFELATDEQFNNIVASETLNGNNRQQTNPLSKLTCYYWRVRANNACDLSPWSASGFTTQDQADYFTEQFTSGDDLAMTRLKFVPNGSGDFYSVCLDSISQLPTDPTGGTLLALTDDSSLPIMPAQPVSFYGNSYATLFVGSNGFVTFNSGDTTTGESISAHFSQPRVSMVFDDLNPPNGTVTYRELADRLAISWVNVPEFNTSNTNTFQIEFFNNGEIHLSWLVIDSNDFIAGLSLGGGTPGDFLASDLSAYAGCSTLTSTTFLGGCLYNLCSADLNTDGLVDESDLGLAFENWQGSGMGDLNLDGKIDVLDMLMLMSEYGNCP